MRIALSCQTRSSTRYPNPHTYPANPPGAASDKRDLSLSIGTRIPAGRRRWHDYDSGVPNTNRAKLAPLSAQDRVGLRKRYPWIDTAAM